jgi:gliding motility-associated-like protein
MFRVIFLLSFILLCQNAFASHVLGGEISYKHLGGTNYQFELIFYRDCNGADVNPVSEQLKVWNHPSLSTINVTFVSRQDISPTCSPVTGSPGPLLCGSGSNGGNGQGAVEKVLYRSAAIALTGVPPANGWIFTYENFSRSNTVSNLMNPANYGITLSAKIYHLDTPDDSPVFFQDPHFVSCAGTPFTFNGNAIDPNLDSLVFSFGIPYNNIQGASYNPPVDTIPVPFEIGFSALNPTPNQSLNPANIPSSLNPISGELSFTCMNIGNYVVKILVKSYRQGILISEVEREMQLMVMPCSGGNNPPVITPPFPGNSFELTVNAGDLVSFNLDASDVDLLQDGSPQTLTMTGSGPMYGTNFTSSTGCSIAPCASLTNGFPLSGTGSISANFNWQTTCDHISDAQGNTMSQMTYNYVFRVQDDYCQVPQVSFATVTIHVLNPGIINAPEINCIQTANTDDLTIFWNPVTNNNNAFVSYQIYSVQNGLIGTVTDINANSFVVPAIYTHHEFYLAVQSGCNGGTMRYSDTISNIFLTLVNPNNGTAVLNWNKPRNPPLPTYNEYFYIYREYPTNFFNFLDSVPYNQTSYIDTIDLCDEFIRYRVNLATTSCNFNSNRPGDNLSDMFTPDMPVIYSVGYDTTTFQMNIQWNQNAQDDTYGYVIYTFDANGFLYELDTVYGIGTTNYSYLTNTPGPFSYSVAAFDSCFTSANPPTFQTSAKALVHTSILASFSINMCAEQAELSWSLYGGATVTNYEIWSKNNNQWTLLGSTTNMNFLAQLTRGQSYCIFIKANLSNGKVAFSNPCCFLIPTPTAPTYHYFKLATVDGEFIELYDYVDASVGITEIIFERKDTLGNFVELGRAPVINNVAHFTDEDVELSLQAWEYRTMYVDSCGNPGAYANTNKTIFATGTADQYNMINTVSWNPYELFDGDVMEYHVYRNAYGTFENTPMAIVPNSITSITDDVSTLRNNGEVCYRIEAVEGLNSYNFSETSRSIDVCIPYDPLVFVPNAFTPDGLNPIFYPVVSNADPKNYTFSIIDRWGQIVFETSDPTKGWDGKISSSGLDATNDVFLYRIEITTQTDELIVKRGYVTLIR